MLTIWLIHTDLKLCIYLFLARGIANNLRNGRSSSYGRIIPSLHCSCMKISANVSCCMFQKGRIFKWVKLLFCVSMYNVHLHPHTHTDIKLYMSSLCSVCLVLITETPQKSYTLNLYNYWDININNNLVLIWR